MSSAANEQRTITALSLSAASTRLSASAALDGSIAALRYVKGKREELLHTLNITTIRDLFLHLPRRYLDYSCVTPIASAELGSHVTIVGTVDRVVQKRPGRRAIVEVYVLDQTGVLRVTFFNQPWIVEQLSQGMLIAFAGKVRFSFGFKEMQSPFYEVLARGEDASKAARIIPVHTLTQGLSAQWMRRIMLCALEDYGNPQDFMPAHLLAKHELMGFANALHAAHFPVSLVEAEQARRRLAYDELVCLQVALRAQIIFDTEYKTGFAHKSGPHLEMLSQALPFKLTPEQRQAGIEIVQDMRAPQPMNRLLLGDVGTGKTVVATLAMAMCADSHTQCAVMVPTSVLATQYAEKVGPLLDAAHISWALITGATPKNERKQAIERIARGEISVVFGTHAILSHDVKFSHLSLVIVDEQHRFGVEQRAQLAQKGTLADVLTMTATPIPRTLALSVYGDVELSTITERPHPGAGTTTQVITPENIDIAFGAIAEEVEAHHQAYVVCPLIEDSEQSTPTQQAHTKTANAQVEIGEQNERKLHSALHTYEYLKSAVFSRYRLALLTGRMKAEEKDAIMQAFKAGEIDILVATTVIEVGVDVPNATALLVYDADRFGLAALHQLRGRVGRGDISGRVFLETPYRGSNKARKRLEALEKTDNGFELAELDLKLRHEGDILGYKQSGEATLTLVDLAQDKDLIEAAHADVIELLEKDPHLMRPEVRPLALEAQARYQEFMQVGARS